MLSSVPVWRSRIVKTALIIFAIFAVIVWAAPNGPFLEVAHSVRLAVALAVIIAYTPICLEAVRLQRIDRVHQLSLGIWMAWAAAFGAGAWALAWRLSGRPEWMADSALNAFFVLCSTLGATLHITAPGAVDGIVPRRNWIMLGAAFGSGALFSAIIILFQPSVGAFIDAMKPWFTGD